MIAGINRGLVLLVEDDDNDVFFFQRAFGKTGYGNALHVAHDGLEAIHYLGGEGEYADRAKYPLPILVVLDLNLPRRHGIDVLRWLRGQPALRSLVVVVLTSSSSELDLAATYELGVNSYLLKPAEPDQLIEIVRMLTVYWLGHNCAPERLDPMRSAVPDPGAHRRIQDANTPAAPQSRTVQGQAPL